MASENYCERVLPLVDEFLADNPWLLEFQQDGSRVHSSKETLAWLEARQIKVMKWPARSPDLNPIEHVWPWMKNYIFKNHGREGASGVSSVALKQAVMQAWEAVPETLLRDLLFSMVKRVAAVIEAHSGAIRW